MRRYGIWISLLLLLAAPASATTYYTDGTNGNDGNTCIQAQSIGTAKATVGAGINCLASGDTLLVRAGTYAETITSVPSGGGSFATATTIQAYNAESVTLKPANGTQRVIWLDGNFSYITFDGINCDGSGQTGVEATIWFSTNNGNDVHHITYKNATVIGGDIGSGGVIEIGGHTNIGATGGSRVQNVIVHGGGTGAHCGIPCGEMGIYLEGPNNLVENSEMYDNKAGCLQIYNAGDDSPDNNIVRNNYCHDQTRYGAAGELWGFIVCGNSNQVYNNVINHIDSGDGIGTGLDLNEFCTGNTSNNNDVWANTVYNAHLTGIRVSSLCNNAVVQDNISYNNGTNYSDAGTGTTFDHNSTNGTDPKFNNAAAGDFHLTASSPGSIVNAGIAVSQVTTDKDGVTRGNPPDLGAYELITNTGVIPPDKPIPGARPRIRIRKHP